MERSKADSFTAFLEEKQRLKSARPLPPQGSTPLTILQVLADAPQNQMPMHDVRSASRMQLESFVDALKTLQESRYLTVSGPPGSETLALTPLGVEVAGLARP